MRYDPKTQRLETDAGELIKEISCPLSKKWDKLMPWADDWAQSIGQNPSGLELGGEWYSWAQLEERGLQPPEPVPARKKYCGSCQKCVIDVNSYTEAQIQAVCEEDSRACGYEVSAVGGCPSYRPLGPWRPWKMASEGAIAHFSFPLNLKAG